MDYYTDANLDVELKVLDVFERKSAAGQAELGRCGVAKPMYKKLSFTHENIGWGQISLPEQELHTTALLDSIPKKTSKTWIRAPTKAPC